MDMSIERDPQAADQESVWDYPRPPVAGFCATPIRYMAQMKPPSDIPGGADHSPLVTPQPAWALLIQ